MHFAESVFFRARGAKIINRGEFELRDNFVLTGDFIFGVKNKINFRKNYLIS